MIVVDSNVLAARLLSGAPTSLAVQVERTDPVWIVPPLWRYEFQNILAKAMWARQLTPEAAVAAWTKASTQLSENEHTPSPEKVLDLSARHRVTAYDANFLALAMEMNLVCVTEDGELQRKFPAIAVGMAEFIRQGKAGDAVRESPAQYDVRTRAKNRKRP